MLHAKLSGMGGVLGMPRARGEKRQNEKRGKVFQCDLHHGFLTLDMLRKRHRFRIPMNDAIPFDAEITQQGGACSAKAEGCIFDDGLAAANGIEEVVKVILAVGVAIGGNELLNVLWQRPTWVGDRILLAVL